jgi:hypothetical protein
MERRTPWFQLVAAVLVIVGLVTLAVPAPAQAMDPQLIMAMASAAGAIALIVGYLIVANGREKERAASLEGIYACTDQEAAGPMGCAGPVSAKSGPASAVVATPRSPMVADGRSAGRAEASRVSGCPAGLAAGPMGCVAPEPVYAASSASPTVPAIQGQ